jgi:Tol biopolymer transport system component
MIQTGYAEFSASRTGTVALHGGLSTTELVLLDRAGREIGQVGEPGAHGMLRLDPSGGMLAVETYDQRLGSRDIWVHDLELGTARRLTLGASDDTDPMWWPVGDEVVFASDVAGAPDIYRMSLSGGGRTTMVRAPFPLEPKDVLPRSGDVIYSVWSRATNADLWRAPPGGSEPSRPYLQTDHSETGARASRDGRWVAFLSDETGSFEVYVARADDASTRRRISVAGGWSPVWRSDGREIYFLSPRGAMVADFDPQSGELAKRPRVLFELDGSVWRGAWDASPDGERFIVNRIVHDSRRDPIRVILDWPATLGPSDRGGRS